MTEFKKRMQEYGHTFEQGSCPPQRVLEARLEMTVSNESYPLRWANGDWRLGCGIKDAPRQTSYFDGRFREFLANWPRRRLDKPAIVLKSVDHGESHSRDGMGRYSANSPRQALLVGVCFGLADCFSALFVILGQWGRGLALLIFW